jgi:hypothetical protein
MTEYIFKIHAQMLELHATYIPTDYRDLFLFLLHTQQMTRALARDAK